MDQALEGHSRAADSKLLTSALRYVSHSRPPDNLTAHRHADNRRRQSRLRKFGENHVAPVANRRTEPTRDVLSPLGPAT